jgi:hypothetical protein
MAYPHYYLLAIPILTSLAGLAACLALVVLRQDEAKLEAKPLAEEARAIWK